MKLLFLVAVLFAAAALHARPLSLAGEWRLALDPRDLGLAAGPETWNFPDTIQLPGTTAGQRKGPELQMELRMDKETMNHLRERHPYVGPAWYQREVEIPASWEGQDIRLTLERVLWESRVWIDRQSVGKPQNSLSVPHRYDLTGHLRPGRTHTITLRIDNRQIVDIGDIGHAYTAGTQTIWNGVIGELKLEALAKVRIDHLGVRKLPGRHGLQLTLEVMNGSAPLNAEIEVSIASRGKTSRAPIHRTRRRLPRGRFIQEIFVPELPKELPSWSEFDPALHRIEVALAGDGFREVVTKDFGLRTFEAEGLDLKINGNKTFLRGNLECAIFPRTGHPDAEGPQWEKIMRTSREYGLNHLRFHSWCPPEAAFEAADRHAIYLQVELPNWTFDMGRKPAVDAFFLAEGERIFREYGHHPSFVMFSLGNELKGDLKAMDAMVARFKKLAPHILFTSTTYAFSPRGLLPGPEDDFFITQQSQSGWVRGQGFLNSNFPSTDSDYAGGLKCLSIPLVTHEVGQYVVYPNLAELPKYKSTPLRSTALEVIRRDLREKALLDDAARFTRDSGKLAALLYKEDIERALRTPGLAGIQLLQLQDFPGQSTATVGLLDAFWDSKGLIEPERFRDFCSPVVPLARMEKFVWENTETLTADLELANFSEATLEAGFTAKLVDHRGIEVAERRFEVTDYPLGNALAIGRYEAPLAAFGAATRLDLVVESDDGSHRNSWPVWVYPAEQDAPEVVTHTAASDACLADLAAGRSVLLLPAGNAIRNPIAARFIPVFWSPLHFPNQPGTLGATIEAGHPLWRHFPTGTHTDWQWWELTANSAAVDLTGFDPAIAKPFRFIDKFNRNALPTAIFEAKVGRGKLLVCTLDVTGNPDERIVARQLQRSLKQHLASPGFDPPGSISSAQLRSLFRESGITATASSNHPDYPASLAIDGDPTTIWHSDWRDPEVEFPITFTLDLQKPTAVAGVRLHNRADNRNGRVKDFQLEISQDGKRWHPVKNQRALPDNDAVETIMLPEPMKLRALRVSARSSHTGQPLASLAEVEIIPAEAADVRDLGIIPGFND